TAVAIVAVMLYAFSLEAIAAPMALVTIFIVCNQHLRIIRAAYITSGSLKPFLAVVVITNGLTLVFALILAMLEYGNFLMWLLGYVIANVVATMVVARAVLVARHEDVVPTDTARVIQREGLRLLPASLGNIALFRPDRL